MNFVNFQALIGCIALVASQAPTSTRTVLNYQLDYFDNLKSYNDAKAVCEGRGSWLVEIKDEAIENAVRDLTNHYLWIGLSKHSGKWKWGDNSSLRYTNWKNGAPRAVTSDNNKYCTLKIPDGGGWGNDDCTKRLRFVCQSDNRYLPYDLKFVDSPRKNYMQAKAACESDGSRLVDIKTDLLNEKVLEGLSEKNVNVGNQYYFIGGNDISTEGSYVWGDGSPIFTTHWYNKKWKEPNGNNNENCIALPSEWQWNSSGWGYRTGWIDISCSEIKSYICQKDIITGDCKSNICNGRGTCKSTTSRYNCSCNAGYFGTKCEKDLIVISTNTPNITVNKGETATASLTIKSYDGEVKIARNGQSDVSIDFEVFTVPSTDYTGTVMYSMPMQLSSATYMFHASPSSDSTAYLRSTSVSVQVVDHCASSPCKNSGTCKYWTTDPYYECTCTPAYDGKTCADARFVTRGNCTYHINQDHWSKTFPFRRTTCSNLGGELAMIKSQNIQTFLQTKFQEMYGDVTSYKQFWVGGEKSNGTWLWLDGREIPLSGADQKWKQNKKDYMILSSYKSTINNMYWYSKWTNESVKGFVCEKAVRDPCFSTTCSNRGTCVSVGCQPKCNCDHGYYGNKCEKESIAIKTEQRSYLVVQGDNASVKLTIESNDGPVNIEYYKTSDEANILGSKSNLGKSATFSIGPLNIQTKNESYTFRASPAKSSNGVYYKYAEIYIGVEGPPSVDIKPRELALPVSERQRTIVCTASGFPAPTANWRVDGVDVTHNQTQARYQIVSGSQATLLFTAEARMQVGDYYCFAKNVVFGRNRMVNGTAFVRATILPVANNSDITESVFKNTTISCTFEGYPEPRIQWKAGGVKLTSGDGTIFRIETFTEEKSPLFRKTSRLTIKLTEYLGTANISCTASDGDKNPSSMVFKINENVVRNGDKSFRVYDKIRKNYESAQAYCRTKQRNLTKILDQKIQDSLANKLTALQSNGAFFIGAQKHSDGSNVLWKWKDDTIFYNQTKHRAYNSTISGKIDGSFVAWYRNEPGVSECMRMEHHQWKWRSAQCDNASGFICESSVGGIPTNLDISVEKCTSVIVVSWIPAEQAVGVRHRIEIRRADSLEEKANNTNQRTPKDLGKVTKKIRNFEYDTSYNVKFIVCPDCPYSYSAARNVTTYALIEAEMAILESVNVSRVGTKCVVSWSLLSSKGLIGFQIKKEVAIGQTSLTEHSSKHNNTEHNLTLALQQYEHLTEPNRIYRFEVAARTCLGIGPFKTATGTCVSETAPPPSVPIPVVAGKPNEDGLMSLQIGIPNETNGPLSCMFVIVVYKSTNAESRTYQTEQLHTASSKAMSDYLTPGDEYIAIAIKGSEIPNLIDGATMLTKKLGDGSTSSCDIAGSDRKRKKRATSSEKITASNRVLEDDADYRSFVVSTVPGENRVHFKSSPVTSFRTPPASTNHAVIGAVAALVVVCLIAGMAGFVFLKRRKRKLSSNDVSLNEMEPNAGRVYANLAMDSSPASETEIPLSQLPLLYNSMVASEGLKFNEQFEKLKEEAKRLVYPTEVASNPVLKKKNRYKNILPSDKYRVTITGRGEFNYINACYINGYRKSKKFIATQGPLPSTVDDFWQMIMEQKCTVVVMLTKCMENGKRKCEKYWPDLGMENSSHDISVMNTEESSYGSFKVRTLGVSRGNQSLTVNHLHFLNWPDHGVPVTTTNLMRFYDFVNNFRSSTPIVVHCSAGAGRTGAFIAYDFLLQEAEHRRSVDVYNCVLKMREQRVDMVQNSSQYMIAHKLLLEHHLFGNTDRDTQQTLHTMSNDSVLSKEFENLSLVAPLRKIKHGDHQKYAPFNRDKNIIPYDLNKVIVVMDNNDVGMPYINASTLEAYVPSTKMIAAQGPLSTTVEYFWRAILDNNVNTVIMLTKCMEGKKEQSVQYWPEENQNMNLKGISIDNRSVNSKGKITTREFEVRRQDDKRAIVQYQYTGWSSDQCPTNPIDVLELVEKMHSSVRRDKDAATLIHCSNGAGRTGAFCAIVNLIERLKLESRVDVFRAVKDLRDCRPGMVQTLGEYRFCYQAVSNYLNSFSIYSNFNVLEEEPKEESIYQNITV